MPGSSREHNKKSSPGYLLLWIAGTTGITAGVRRQFAGDIALSESEAKFRSLFESMQEGFALHEIICDEP